MQAKLIALLMLAGGVICAAPGEQELKLVYQMQAAVLETQSFAKIEALLKQGVDVNAPIGCGTYSPLDGAIDKQNVGMLEFLLAHGAKPPARSLARAAFSSGNQQALEMTQALIAVGVDPNTRDIDANNALLSATYRGNQELVGFLLSQKGIQLDEFDVDGFTALMWAVKHGSSEIVDMLLHAGASVQIANQRGVTAITISGQEIEKQQVIVRKLKAAAR